MKKKRKGRGPISTAPLVGGDCWVLHEGNRNIKGHFRGARQVAGLGSLLNPSVAPHYVTKVEIEVTSNKRSLVVYLEGKRFKATFEAQEVQPEELFTFFCRPRFEGLRIHYIYPGNTQPAIYDASYSLRNDFESIVSKNPSIKGTQKYRRKRVSTKRRESQGQLALAGV